MDIEFIRNELGHPEVPTNGNHYFLKNARSLGDKVALYYPESLKNGNVEYRTLTYDDFYKGSLEFAGALTRSGIKEGDRVIILYPVSVELYQIICALFYIGAIPVSIDYTMGKKKIIQSIKLSKAKGIISTNELFKFTIFMPSIWFKKRFSLMGSFFSKSLEKLKALYEKSEAIKDPKDFALISYTSGSTGTPKGANRSVDILMNQKLIGEYLWPHSNEEIDLTSFPMIILQNLGCGMTSVLPFLGERLDKFDPEVVIDQMKEKKVTRFSAQPFFIESLCDKLIEKNETLDFIDSLIVGGATVSRALCKKVLRSFPNADCNIVYGSTEAEPISYVPMKDYVDSEELGHLVGNVIPVIGLKIIDHHQRSSDLEGKNLDDFKFSGEFGEVVISGPHVIREYIDNHPANKKNKIRDDKNILWHRTGDLARLDEKGRVWLVGRDKDLVDNDKNIKIPTYIFEEQIDSINGIKRSALVQSHSKKALFIRKENEYSKDQLDQILKSGELTDFKIIEVDSMPVDGRHFSRVDRQALRDAYLSVN